VSTDLHTQLAAKINERLELARAASPGPWQVVDPNEGSDHFPFWMVVNDAFLNPHLNAEDAPSLDVELHTGCEADARLVAASDPATTIRFCERDLRVLARHSSEQIRLRNGDWPAPWCSICDCDCNAERWPCPEIRDLADAYRVDLLVPTKEET